MSTQEGEKGRKAGWIARIVRRGLIFAAILLAGIVLLVWSEGYEWIRGRIQKPAGARMSATALGNALKVDGQFTPLTLDQWKIKADAFTSHGRQGEALGELKAEGISATFDPCGILHGAWKFDRIDLQRAEIQLVPPGPKAPQVNSRRWFAFLMPSHFECGPIVCPHTNLLYAFSKSKAHIDDAHVEAQLIGRDLKYTVTSGTLNMPYLPPLRIRNLVMLVTRSEIRVYSADLIGVKPGSTAHLTLSGRIGQHEDKSIEATGTFTDLPIDQAVPSELDKLVHGTACGTITWQRDRSGNNVDSEADIQLTQTTVQNLTALKQLKLLDGDPSLNHFVLDATTGHFHLHGGMATLQISAQSKDMFTLDGTATYELDNHLAGLDMNVTNIPLKNWLPPAFQTNYGGMAQAHLNWHGEPDSILKSKGTLAICLDGAQVVRPALLRHFAEQRGLRTPDEFDFKTARFNFDYAGESLQMTQAQLDVPGVYHIDAHGVLNSTKQLNAAANCSGLIIQDWLPPAWAHCVSGEVQTSVQLRLDRWSLATGSYQGHISVAGANLQYTFFQSILARFLNDRSLLDLPLSDARMDWCWDKNRLTLTNLDLRARQEVAIEGGCTFGSDRTINGDLHVGVTGKYLRSTMGLGNAIFDHSENGLQWAHVKLWGTISRPHQDLSTQLAAQIGKHPTAVIGLTAKMISWLVGDALGEHKNWERPVPADGTKTAAR